MEVDINYWAVLVAAVASMVVGFLWYGVLFKKPWMALMGITTEGMSGMKMTANKAYVLQFIGSILMAMVLAHALVFTGAYFNMEGIRLGAEVAFWNWLGFIVPITLGVVLWENKSWKLWLINASHYLVSLVVMGVILSLWR